jgi:hypothetical protein
VSSYDGIPFNVKAVRRGVFPHVSDDRPIAVYRCQAKIGSTANKTALLDRRSRITVDSILGVLDDCFVHVDAGPGAGNLTVPDEAGVSTTFPTAYLTRVDLQTDGRVDDQYYADLEFSIRTVTP